MNQGKLNGYICQGFNPVGSFPNKKKIVEGLSKLEVPRHHRSADDRDRRVLAQLRRVQRRRRPNEIQTTVFRLPSTCFAEEDGSLDQLRPLAAVALEGRRAAGRGQGRHRDHRGASSLAFARPTQKDGGAYPDPIVNLTWPYKIPHAPSAQELAMEYNGQRADRPARPEGPDQGRQQPRPASSSRASACCATTARTASGCWIYSGAWTQAGNQMARRDNADPYGIGHGAELGVGLAGEPAHPLQRCLDRSGHRQAVDRQARPHRVERQAVDRRRRSRHPARREPDGSRRGAAPSS